jgi:hypothetical protein
VLGHHTGSQPIPREPRLAVRPMLTPGTAGRSAAGSMPWICGRPRAVGGVPSCGGAEYCVTSGDVGVFVEEAAEPVASDDLDVGVDGIGKCPERAGMVPQNAFRSWPRETPQEPAGRRLRGRVLLELPPGFTTFRGRSPLRASSAGIRRWPEPQNPPYGVVSQPPTVGDPAEHGMYAPRRQPAAAVVEEQRRFMVGVGPP